MRTKIHLLTTKNETTMAELENNYQDQVLEETMEKEQVLQEGRKAEEQKKSDSVNITFSKVMEYVYYVLALVLLIAAIVTYTKDLRCYDTQFDFIEHKYVGGDAYNYMISASRSSAVMIKCLILTVSGFSFAIIGRLTALINKK